MGVENEFWRHFPGAMFLILGLVSQLYLGHRLHLPKGVNWALGGVLVAVSVVTQIEKLRLGFLDGVVNLWCWVLVAPAVVFWLLARIPRRQFQPQRRALLTTAASVLCAAPAAAFTTGIIIRKDFRVNEMDLKFPNLPKDLRGLRLLQISDIHMGDYFSPNDLRRAVDACNALRADLAFVTGDLITTKHDPLDQCLLELKRLRSNSGIWGCLGNHEMHENIQNYTTRKALESNIVFLRHQAVPLTFGQSRLNLVGVDHQRPKMPYLEHVSDLVKPGEFNLLLSHNPDVFPVAARQGFELTLAGHTHGGQINLALAGQNLNIVDLVTPFTKGLYQLPHSSLYVNSGLGTIGVPVRLGAPPEITLIRLCDS